MCATPCSRAKPPKRTQISICFQKASPPFIIPLVAKFTKIEGKGLTVDGGMGPSTIGALKGVGVERVRAYRVKYYVDLNF